MTIPTISTLPVAPARTDAPATFVTRADSFLAALVVMQGELNTSIGAMNTDIANINDASAAASIALAAANFKGAWADLTGALDIPASVSHAGNYWLVLQDLPDVTASEPSAGNSDWEALPVIPSQTGNSGKFLTTDGTSTSWATLSLDPTLGTLTKTFLVNEQATISLSGTIASQIPTVSGTKEIAQTGVTTNRWNIDSTNDNYAIQNSAYDTTLDIGGFYLNSPTYTKFFSISAKETNGRGVAFNTDGSKMYITGATSDAVHEYNLSVSFDISTSVFSKTFSVSAQDSQPYSVRFNNDGSKMFVFGYTNRRVNAYDLSINFDIGSAVFNQFISLAAEDVEPKDVAFSLNGLKMFAVGAIGRNVIEYDLSVSFDISTAVFNQSFSVISQDSVPTSVQFSPSGTKMFVLGDTGNSIYLYNLSTGYDVSTAVYSNSFSVAAQMGSPYGLAFSADGTQIYAITTTVVAQYSMPSLLQLGTGSFSSDDVSKRIEANNGVFLLAATTGAYEELTAPTSYAQSASGEWAMSALYYGDNTLILSGVTGNPDIVISDLVGTKAFTGLGSIQAVSFSSDGTKMFAFGITNPDSMYQYSLSVPFDVSSAVYDGVSLDIGTAVGNNNLNTGIISDDGFHVYAVDNNTIWQFDLTSPFDLSTASYFASYVVSAQEVQANSVRFNNNGSRMYVMGLSGDDVNQYNLSVPYNINTAVYNSLFSVAAQSAIPRSFVFSRDGSKMYMASTTTIFQYSLSNPFQINSASYDSVSFVYNGLYTSAYSINLSYDQKSFYIMGTNSTVYQIDVENTILLTGYQLAITKSSIDTTYWTDINSMTANDDAKDSLIYYSISSDDRTTWQVIDNANGVRNIVKNNAGTWQYNFDATYANETWLNGTTNTEEATLIEAMTIANNRMDKAQINGVSDANQITLTNNLDLAILFNADSGTKTPFSSGIEINYDGNVLNESIVLGTDFNVDMPATDKVRITAINAGNYKLRVV